MQRSLVIACVLVAGIGAGHAQTQKRDRPVGDDSTDAAPLNQKPQTAPEDHQIPFGSADQGGGNGNHDASDTHAK